MSETLPVIPASQIAQKMNLKLCKELEKVTFDPLLTQYWFYDNPYILRKINQILKIVL